MLTRSFPSSIMYTASCRGCTLQNWFSSSNLDSGSGSLSRVQRLLQPAKQTIKRKMRSTSATVMHSALATPSRLLHMGGNHHRHPACSNTLRQTVTLNWCVWPVTRISTSSCRCSLASASSLPQGVTWCPWQQPTRKLAAFRIECSGNGRSSKSPSAD